MLNRRFSQTQVSQNGQTLQHFYLTQRGVLQSSRNNSTEIWKVMGCMGEGYCFCGNCSHKNRNYCRGGENEKERGFIDSGIKNQQQNYLDDGKQGKVDKKQVRFEGEQMNLNNKIVENRDLENKQFSRTNPKQKVANNLKSSSANRDPSREKYLKQCYLIEKYLQKNKAHTRQLATSKIQLFYDRPCIEAYGRKNTSGNNGIIYNDYMKTHNTIPHRFQNEPKKYQSYRSALNFGKRTKLDPEDRWKKIHRQMIGKLNSGEIGFNDTEDVELGYEDLEQTLNLTKVQLELDSTSVSRSKSLDGIRVPMNARNIKSDKSDLDVTKATTNLADISTDRVESLKRSKSWGKKEHLFLLRYKNKNGDIQHCKDRHGITCYVDPTFKQNRQAFTSFLKKIGPIEAEDVDESDRNIDKTRIQNFLISKQEDAPHHYLLPNTDEPYRPEKYSRWKKNKSAVKEY